MADMAAMQAQIRALEAQLAAAKEQEAAADPDGEYILEEYEEEEYGDGDDDDVYVIEEYVDDGQEFDDEIEIVEEYEDDEEYEEVIEDEEYEDDEGLPHIDPVVDNEPMQKSFSSENNKSVTFADNDLAELRAVNAAAKAAPAPPAPKPVVASPRNLRPTPKPAPGKIAPAVSGGGGALPIFGGVTLKKTGIKLDEKPNASPYNFGPPPKAQPRAVAARDAAADAPKAHSFLAGVQQTQDLDQEKEDRALALANGDPAEAGVPRKKWVPMKDRQPDKYPKNTIELREKPISRSTRLAPLPFSTRKYPTVPASPMGFQTAAEKMMGSYLYKNVKMERINVTAALQDQDILLLYFGASWKAGCKAFHQSLIDFYKLTSKDCNVECVYVSADRTLFEFKDLFQKFPFLAMPSGTAELKNQMTKDFHIADMPALIVLNARTCQVITLEGVEDLSTLPARDREFAQKMVAKWKVQQPLAASENVQAKKPIQKKKAVAKKSAAAAPAEESAPEPPAAAATGEKVTSGSSKPMGRKEKKGIFSWRKG